jgi:hypothetical protein
MPIDLDDELRSIAHALVAEAPEVPTSRRVTVTESSALRSLILAAAVTIAIVGAGALYLVRQGDDWVGTATAPTELPVVIGEISWPSVLPIVEDGNGLINAPGVDEFRVAAATLARRVDGALVDPVVVEVGTDYPPTHADGEPSDIVGVFGQTAHVYTSLEDVIPLAVVIGDDPYIAVSGVDPMAFLNRVAEDFVRPDVPADGGPITLEFGDLPDGYEVIYNEPEPDHATAYVATFLDSPSPAQQGVFVGTEPFMIGRDALPVDVNGTSAWLSTDGAHADVSWPVATGTYASVRADAADAALELARSLRFVALDEWADATGVDLDAVEPGDRVSFTTDGAGQSAQTSMPS